MQKERSRDCSRYIYGSIRPSWILQHAGYMSASEELGEDPTLLTVTTVQHGQVDARKNKSFINGWGTFLVV